MTTQQLRDDRSPTRACASTAYADGGGVWTIGVGHTGPEVKRGLLWDPRGLPAGAGARHRARRTGAGRPPVLVAQAYARAPGRAGQHGLQPRGGRVARLSPHLAGGGGRRLRGGPRRTCWPASPGAHRSACGPIGWRRRCEPASALARRTARDQRGVDRGELGRRRCGGLHRAGAPHADQRPPAGRSRRAGTSDGDAHRQAGEPCRGRHRDREALRGARRAGARAGTKRFESLEDTVRDGFDKFDHLLRPGAQGRRRWSTSSRRKDGGRRLIGGGGPIYWPRL